MKTLKTEEAQKIRLIQELFRTGGAQMAFAYSDLVREKPELMSGVAYEQINLAGDYVRMAIDNLTALIEELEKE